MSDKPTRKQLHIDMERAGAAMANAIDQLASNKVKLSSGFLMHLAQLSRAWDLAYGRVQQAAHLTGESALGLQVPLLSLPVGWMDAMNEVGRATQKFRTWPTDPLHALAVLGEEFGELTKAVLQTAYEPHKVKDGELRTEAIQTAAMALRFVASLDRYEFTQSAQHEQGRPTAIGAADLKGGAA